MQFLDKIGNIIGRLTCFLTALIFALVPFLFIKELLSAPSWSPGFFAYLAILMMVGGSLYFLYAAFFYNRIMRKRALEDEMLKKEQLRQLAAIQEERFRNPIDTTTLILLDNVTDYEHLETLILDNMAEDEGTLENLPLLWKRGEGSYAITFPCGVSRQVLCDLVDDIGCSSENGCICVTGRRICWSPSPKTRRNGTSTPKMPCCIVPKGTTVSSNPTRKSTGQDWKR